MRHLVNKVQQDLLGLQIEALKKAGVKPRMTKSGKKFAPAMPHQAEPQASLGPAPVTQSSQTDMLATQVPERTGTEHAAGETLLTPCFGMRTFLNLTGMAV